MLTLTRQKGILGTPFVTALVLDRFNKNTGSITKVTVASRASEGANPDKAGEKGKRYLLMVIILI
jgi:hypothetical protein